MSITCKISNLVLSFLKCSDIKCSSTGQNYQSSSISGTWTDSAYCDCSSTYFAGKKCQIPMKVAYFNGSDYLQAKEAQNSTTVVKLANGADVYFDEESLEFNLRTKQRDTPILTVVSKSRYERLLVKLSDGKLKVYVKGR